MTKEYHAENAKKNRRTKSGLIGRTYSQQKSSSRKRKHNPPTYSRQWLFDWLLSNPEFHRLYDIWVISGYEKNMRPSVDRIDDALGYTEYNIQLIIWEQNNHRGHEARRKGKNLQGKICKRVVQKTKEKEFVAEYHSLQEAQRQTGVNNISKCCLGKSKLAGGYIWEFK